MRKIRELRTKREAFRLVAIYTALAVSASASLSCGFAALNGWSPMAALAPGVLIPLLLAPWMLWTLASAALRLEEMRKELERLVRTDPLSGALNRRGLAEFAERAFAARGRGGSLSVIVVDIDRFKSINDVHGHAAGDFVIRRVAELMRQIVGAENTAVGRLGGDELGAFVVGRTLEETIAVAERLRDAIEFTIFAQDDLCLRATASIGVAVAAPSDPSPEAMLLRADESLYRAKAAGRNRVRASARAA